ncbi:MAG: hypothetical protein ACRD4Q_13350, partial [Candidatus Acidiferrales bacterium]
FIRSADDIDKGLGLVNSDIVTHAAGRQGNFAIPGLLSKMSSAVLAHYETPPDVVDEFVKLRQNDNVHVEVLHGQQALSISGGQIQAI